MSAEQKQPKYTVYVVSGDKKYNLTPAVVSLDRSESDKQISQSVTLQIKNQQIGGEWLSTLLKPRSRVFIYANDGSGEKEVFRGFLWVKLSQFATDAGDVTYKCYDNLIYLQESEDSLYFSSGKSTKDICSSICSKWGIKLDYSYDSITHAKMPLQGYLADIFTSDLLEAVKKKTKKKYVILSDQDAMYVKPVGANTTIYRFISGKNVIKTGNEWTMDGVITKVVILGKADGDDREPVEATISGNTSEYGTLQKIQKRNDNTSLADAKLEAKNIIDEDGKPKWQYTVTAPDIPWIRKGDKIYVSAGDITGYKIITEIDRTIDQKTREMSMTLKDE